MRKEIITVNQANIVNGHIYLTAVLNLFPEDSIGGSNKTKQARKLLTVTYKGLDPITTDIAGDKRMFRDRSVVKRFFRQMKVRDGDHVSITKCGDYEYLIEKA